MKVVPFLAVANAALAVLSALLGAAPFTPALALFLLFLPLAALFARQKQVVASLLVLVSAVVAIFLSPIMLTEVPAVPLLVIAAWFSIFFAIVIYYSRHKFMAAISAVRRGKTHGA